MLFRPDKKIKKALSHSSRSGRQWLNNLPILSKMVTVLLTLDILMFLGFMGIDISRERDEIQDILEDRAKAELAAVENIYINSTEQVRSVSQAQAENAAIISAAQQYNDSGRINPELRGRVNQILRNTEVNSETARKAFLVGKDSTIIAGGQPRRTGEKFNPDNLASSVLSDPEQPTVHRVIPAQEIRKKYPDFYALSSPKNTLMRYTLTPVKTWETREVQGILVSANLVAGKNSILDRSMYTIGEGYSAIYLQKPGGEPILAGSLLDLKSREFSRHRDRSSEYFHRNVPLPDTRILTEVVKVGNETITQRMSIGGSRYTVAMKTLANTPEETAVILVRGTPEVKILSLIHGSIKRGLWLIIFALALTLIFSIILAHIISEPITKLQETTRKFAGGNLQVRARVTGTDEIGQLAALFNKMADEIVAALDREAANTQAQVGFNKELKEQIEERSKIEKQLKNFLREKETLLKEIHHRVKNNLFVVSNLLEFQADYLDDPKLTQALEDSRNRIYSMALIHQQLYRSTNLRQIDFSAYLEELVENLVESYNGGEDRVEFHFKGEPILLNIETANPCGLIVNELISNVFKHAFAKGRSGRVWLGIHRRRSGEITLSVKDDGAGFPEGVNFRQVNSLGMELICTLSEQLEGTIEMKRRKGTLFTLRFYELQYRPRIAA